MYQVQSKIYITNYICLVFILLYAKICVFIMHVCSPKDFIINVHYKLNLYSISREINL